jgi:Tol biopolymer transport system component
LPDSRGLIAPRWSPDGRYVAALVETNHRLLLYDFQTEKWKFLAEGGLLGAPYWMADSSAIYFQDQLDNEQAIFRIPIASLQLIGFSAAVRFCAAARHIASSAASATMARFT